jgi:hypothetical protein
MAFRTFRNQLLSIWQSVVAEDFPSRENDALSNAVVEATADYCEIAERHLDEGEAGEEVSFEDIEPALREGPREQLRYLSGAHHYLGMAFSQGNFDAASAVQSKLRPFEEGVGNLRQWKNCSIEYARYVSRVQSGPQYRSPEFDSHLMLTFSVIDDVLSAADARIAIVGDWGTGEPVADLVMKGILAQKPDLLIHLGDVYTSGTNGETYTRFYNMIRSKIAANALPVFVLAGNHDYYSGGDGFYQLIDHLNVPTAKQAASYFCLRNDYWQILAMDTGYKDANPHAGFLKKLVSAGKKRPETNLRDDEFRWHKHQLEQADGRGTILLSHHQPFSAYDAIGRPTKGDSLNTNLKKRFSPYFSAVASRSQVRAWFWGHEHDLVPIARGHHGLDLGVCMGHGAIPVDSKKVPRPGSPPYNGRDPYTPFKALGTDAGGYFNHGFAVLQLSKTNGYIEHWEVDETGIASVLFGQTF